MSKKGNGIETMYEIRFYRDKNGNEPVRKLLEELAARAGKDARINLNKINDYMKILMEKGTRAGEPFVKHLENDIWELRPLSNRILFAAWYDNSFILLHYFVKKTQKIPRRELETAKRRYQDMKERSEDTE